MKAWYDFIYATPRSRRAKKQIFKILNKRNDFPSRIIKTREHFKISLDPADPNQRFVYWYGRYNENDEIKLIKRILSPGDIFIDVGANIGYFTLTSSLCVGSSGKVVAFEPNPFTYNVLLQNIKLNHYSNIDAIQEAVGECDGEAELFISEGIADAGASLVRKSTQKNTIKIRKVTLDSYTKTHNIQPDFIKIDAEGFDEQVLEGANTILAKKKKPVLLVETVDNKSTIFTKLCSLGYVPVILHKHKWHRFSPQDNMVSNNTLWIPEDTFEQFKIKVGNLYRGR